MSCGVALTSQLLIPGHVYKVLSHTKAKHTPERFKERNFRILGYNSRKRHVAFIKWYSNTRI